MDMKHDYRGVKVKLSAGSNAYPDKLATIRERPDSLYVIERSPEWKRMPSVAIIGVRRATPYGLACAQMAARAAAEMGVLVVSGGALGIDTVAHTAAMEAGGKTVAVLAGGADWAYPEENAGMFQEIIDEGGALVAEREWGTAPTPYMFRERNRITTGLADLLLVCECGVPSGTFSAVDEAQVDGRLAYAIPGSIFAEQSFGCNQLIADGIATPVVGLESWCSILKDLIEKHGRES